MIGKSQIKVRQSKFYRNMIFFRDLFICLLVFPVVVLIFIVVGILLRLDSPGPILFKHKRVGLFGKALMVYKFRTMYFNPEGDIDPMMSTKELHNKRADDERITPVGRILRKYSIDEIPQIINILKGEMSWIGPRPVTERELAFYQEDRDILLSFLPGITGWWQVNGRSTTTIEERIRLEREYLFEYKPFMDIIIIIKTVWVIISGTGR